MPTLHQFSAVSAPVTTLIDAAAELETRTREAEARVQALQRDLEQLQQRQAQIRQWLRTIRSSHRPGSHAATSKLITQALSSLDPTHPIVISPF